MALQARCPTAQRLRLSPPAHELTAAAGIAPSSNDGGRSGPRRLAHYNESQPSRPPFAGKQGVLEPRRRRFLLWWSIERKRCEDEETESDVDFLVDVKPNHSSFSPGGLIADLEELLERKVEIVTENGLHWYIKNRILEEAKPL